MCLSTHVLGRRRGDRKASVDKVGEQDPNGKQRMEGVIPKVMGSQDAGRGPQNTSIRGPTLNPLLRASRRHILKDTYHIPLAISKRWPSQVLKNLTAMITWALNVLPNTALPRGETWSLVAGMCS